MKTSSGIYIGTVIENSDVGAGDGNALGRVRVLIKGKSDMKAENYKLPRGGNLCKSMSNDGIKTLQKTEVWAYVLQPNTGGAAAGKFNASTNVTVPAGSPHPSDLNQRPPGKSYSIGNIVDKFISTITGSAGVNATGYSYAPDLRSTGTHGQFSVPPVGATVAIQFINGNRGMPIVIGTIYGAADIASVQAAIGTKASPGYPLAYENVPATNPEDTTT